MKRGQRDKHHSIGEILTQVARNLKPQPGFADAAKVMNGASDLMVTVFGDKGRHARSTIGVSSLPLDAAVEVEGAFEVS